DRQPAVRGLGHRPTVWEGLGEVKTKNGRAPPGTRPSFAARDAGRASVDRQVRSPDRLRLTPVALQDGPEVLVPVLAVALEGPAEGALTDRTELAQRAVAAAVCDRRPRLEPVHAERVEREREHGLGAGHERARAPVRR